MNRLIPQSSIMRMLVVIGCVLVGAFCATAALLGFVTFRGGAPSTELGPLEGGRDPHAIIIEFAGADMDLGVPLPALWGQVWLEARATETVFLGQAELVDVRTYLSGTAYAFASFTEGQWAVRPVPGEGRPEKPEAASLWSDSASGSEVALPADRTIVVMRADSRRPVEVVTNLQFRPTRAPFLIALSTVLAAACLVVSIAVTRAASRRPDDREGVGVGP